MKPLRRLLDRIEPAFKKGGKLEKFYPLYEGFDTFLYTPGEVTSGLSHVRDAIDLKRMMITVVVALLPCIFMAMYNTGYQANSTIRGNLVNRNKQIGGEFIEHGLISKAQYTTAVHESVDDRIEHTIVELGYVDKGKVQNLQVGIVLQMAGVISREQVDLAMQLVNGRLLEEIVVQQKFASEEDATEAILVAAEDLKRVGVGIGWRGWIMSLLHLKYAPDCLLSNLIYGALYFIPVFLVCNIVGGAWEVLFSCVRKHEINEGFLVTGMLFPLTLPPTIPLWQVALGISFGVVIGKEVFGGTGKNFLNPALTARAFLYFAYPIQMTGDRVWTVVDGFSGATPLAALAVADVATGMDAIDITWAQAFLGQIQGSMGETSTLACLFGAALLILTGVGSWRIMAAVLAGAMGLSTLLYLFVSSETNAMFQMPPHWHLVVGGLAFGLVFMATDPVSAAMTETGKWVYGVLIGAMTILIRVVNPAYPEGIMLAILFGNVFAPLIDYFVVQANIKRRLSRNAA